MESPTDPKPEAPKVHPYKNKTVFTRIFEEHAATLFVKNYTERMIGSRSENGLFLKQLHAAFKQAYTTDPERYQIHRFPLEMTGFFSRQRKDGSRPKDKVKFEFSYAFDPSGPKSRLSIISLKATMNDEFEKVYPITEYHSNQLPPSGKVYQELFDIREKQLIEKIQEQLNKNKKAKRVRRK